MIRLSALLTAAVLVYSPSSVDAKAKSPLLATWRGHFRPVRSVVFTPDGKRILSASDDGIHKLWDISSGKVLATWKGDTREMGAASITPDGTKAISGGEGYILRVWELATGKILKTIKGKEDGIRTVALSPDGRTAAAVSFNGGLALWDIRSGRRIETLQKEGGLFTLPGEQPAEAMSVAFSPDGKKLFVGEYHYGMRLWDVAKRKTLLRWRGHDNPVVLSLAVSPDGKKGLSGGRDNTLRLWNLSSGKLLLSFKGHKSFVEAVAISPDGRSALSASADYTIKKWDLKTGRELAAWRGHGGSVRAVAFSPDGTLAASGGDDYTVRVWDVAGEGDLKIKPARPTVPSVRSDASRKKDPASFLGKTLFFDHRLSGDGTVSCATCHRPERAFTDGMALPEAYPVNPHFRNTPSLINAAAGPPLYWDGRFPASELSSAIRDHFAEAHFMNADGRLLVERLRQAPGYVEMFRNVYNGDPTYDRILEALASFIRTLKSGESPYDRYVSGDRRALGSSAVRGRDLFFGKGRCAQCHKGSMFTDEKFHDRGVPENPEIFEDPFRQISFRRFFKTLGVKNYAGLRKDLGLYSVTRNRKDKGKFKTPSLREVARTGPYMHNGIFPTLADAVASENRRLSRRETRDIVSFLEALSSEIPKIKAPPLPAYAVLPTPAASRRRPEAALPRVIARSRQKDFAALGPLPDVPIPKDNPQTPAKIELGKRLFCEPLLSGNRNNYCCSCHVPFQGWGDGSDLSQGHSGALHWRNSQTILNAAFFSKLNWDGSQPSLEEQARHAILSGISGNGDAEMIEERLAQLPEYVKLFKKAFGVERPHFEGVIQALAAFQREIPISRNAPFDRYMRGDKTALSASAVRGLKIFKGKATCIQCHNGPLVSDQGFHATGAPNNPAFANVPLRQITLRYQHVVRGVPEEIYRRADSDPGLYLTTLREEDIGKFRTPSLRELNDTAPYMHNGIFETLEEVVDFYDRGGGESPNKTPLLKPLKLRPSEKKDLIAFLESLSMPLKDR